MALNETNNLVDKIVDTQKKVLDSVVENTKKFTTGNNPLNETIEKGTDWYKNWLESQKNLFTKAAGHAAATEAPKEAGNTTTKTNEFFDNWMNAQANWAKQIWEMSQESAKQFTNTAGTNPFTSGTNPFTTANPFANAANPFANWQHQFSNMQHPMTAWMNNMPNNNWMNNMHTANPFNADAFKKAGDTMSSYFSQYYNSLNSSMTDWMKNFDNNTVIEAYKNMINSGDGFTKFAEIWAPMLKSIQDKTFNMDAYKQMMNPEIYKDLMDKFFGFMPEASREHMNKMTTMMNEQVKQMSEAGMENFNKMRGMMGGMNNGAEMFGNMNAAYGKWNNMMTEAAAPFTKMMTPTEHTKTMQVWSDISKRITEYNIKNAELQYMIYNQGTKVMDKLAENIANKVKNGTEVTSMLGLYQEWLNISDKVFVSLFESNEYSKLMGEVTSMQNRLRKDIDLQMEKGLKDIPVATRSEMDDVYKTIYELKKKVRQLETMLDIETEEEETETAAPAAKKSATKTATASKKK